MLDSKGRSLVQVVIDVMAKPLARKGVSPNKITVLGLCIGLASAFIYGFLGLSIVAVVLLFCGCLVI